MSKREEILKMIAAKRDRVERAMERADLYTGFDHYVSRGKLVYGPQAKAALTRLSKLQRDLRWLELSLYRHDKSNAAIAA